MAASVRHHTQAFVARAWPRPHETIRSDDLDGIPRYVWRTYTSRKSADESHHKNADQQHAPKNCGHRFEPAARCLPGEAV
jgi:hypothetical protein